MRFDDSLETILAADMATPFGARSTWQQLVDLIGRGRIAPSPAAIGKLQALCTQVPPAARAASARSLAFAEPPAALVRLFAGDEISIAAPLLRIARLDAAAWIEMLPEMSPGTRSILRHRRDLPAAVNRALESFGSVDFVLANAGSSGDELPAAPSDLAGSAPATTTRIAQPAMSATPSESPFVSFASIALGLPVVAEALRHGKDTAPKDKSIAVADPNAVDLPPPREVPAGTFQIAELVARIDAYQRQRESASRAAGAFSVPVGGAEVQPELFALDPAPSRSFRFETDATGTVRWVDGAARAPLIGLSLDLAPSSAQSQVDGVAAGAFRRRAGFTNARLVVEGRSDAAGQWRINGIPVFDRASGRFTGYRGTARRPRADEMAEPARPESKASSDALRQLVHELRTPTNAIAGFAEMIESQMLGPVAAPYRAHAAAIRGQASELLYAIDDIDLAARIDADALDLRSGDVLVAPLLARIAEDLAPLAAIRGATLQVDSSVDALAIAGDDRAVERLIARLLATVISSCGPGERIGVAATIDAAHTVELVFDRPQALGAYPEERLLTIDAEIEAEREGAPLLGTGFALRLARNLATELGGSLTFGGNALTLRLPAALLPGVEQVSSS